MIFSTMTSAINRALLIAENKGYSTNEDELFNIIGLGKRKPDIGNCNRYSIPLYKNGKLDKKALQIQVFGFEVGYELNYYIL